jgi:hypothetical protein
MSLTHDLHSISSASDEWPKQVSLLPMTIAQGIGTMSHKAEGRTCMTRWLCSRIPVWMRHAEREREYSIDGGIS